MASENSLLGSILVGDYEKAKMFLPQEIETPVTYVKIILFLAITQIFIINCVIISVSAIVREMLYKNDY